MFATGANVRFTFELTRQDHAAFEEFVIKRLATRARRSTVVVFIAVLVAWIPFGYGVGSVVLLYSKYPRIASDLTSALLALALAAGTIWASVLFRRRRARRVLLATKNWSFGTYAAVADAERLEVDRPGVATCYDWSIFSECVETDGAFYLFLHPMQAVTIMKSGFGSAAELDEFRAWAQRKPQPAEQQT